MRGHVLLRNCVPSHRRLICFGTPPKDSTKAVGLWNLQTSPVARTYNARGSRAVAYFAVQRKPLGANHHEEHLPNSKISSHIISNPTSTGTMHPNQNSSLTIALTFSQDMIT